MIALASLAPSRRTTVMRASKSTSIVFFSILLVLSVSAIRLSAQLPKRYTREQLAKLVIGKNREQIVEILGKPNEVNGNGSIEYWWYTTRITVYDPVTDKTFAQVILHFWRNKCDDIMF